MVGGVYLLGDDGARTFVSRQELRRPVEFSSQVSEGIRKRALRIMRNTELCVLNEGHSTYIYSLTIATLKHCPPHD